jgi:hypothetical protein
MREARGDIVGFLIAAALTTAPLLALTFCYDLLSKNDSAGLPAYLVPGAVGLTVAALIALGGHLVGRGHTGPVGPTFYVGFGCLASVFLVVSYCGWWGAWSLRYAERFRP